MNSLTELQEAKAVATEVLARIDHARSSLDSAKFWGLFDIGGGGAVASFMKRRKIQGANEEIQAVMASLKVLNKELADVNMTLPDEISNTLGDTVWDVWLDNVFTDVMVQKDINHSRQQLKEFRQTLEELLENLTLEIEQLS